MGDTVLSRRRIVLGITGSVAAYKACNLVRRLKDAGAEVRVVMTRNAQRFVGKATFLSISGDKVVTDMWDPDDEWSPEHVTLGRWAEIVLVAPATANIIGKAASGIADDILSTTILSARCKVVFAPAMNSAMYNNPIVQSNMAKLGEAGYEFIPPETGLLACGEEGIGRLADLEVIVEKLKSLLREVG